MLAALVAIVFAALYLTGHRRDPRMLRNGVFLTAALVALLVGALELVARSSPDLGKFVFLLLLAVVYLVLVLGVLLVVNGFAMLRREGRSLGNRLSLLTGGAVVALPAFAVVVALVGGTVGRVIAVIVCALAVYAAFAVVSFALYSVVYARLRLRSDASSVVVHGSGLVGGQVPPLLRGRLDRGIAVYDELLARGADVVLVPSGGQGADEPRPEAVAMAEYLVAAGVPVEDVVLEDQSTTTRSNIERSVALLDERGREGALLLVTSDYHVLRTASLARRLGVDAQVVGAPTAWYYVPSAFLREFVAIMSTHRRAAASVLVPFLAATVGFALWGLDRALLL